MQGGAQDRNADRRLRFNVLNFNLNPEGPVSAASYFLGGIHPPDCPFSRFARRAVTGNFGVQVHARLRRSERSEPITALPEHPGQRMRARANRARGVSGGSGVREKRAWWSHQDYYIYRGPSVWGCVHMLRYGLLLQYWSDMICF
jgi:hypothetical protein